MPMAGRRRLPQGPGRSAPDRGVAAHRGRPGPDPVRSRHDGGPASSAGRGTGRRRAGRSRTDRADRARMPGRPALGRLGSIAHRRRVGPASSRVRLPQPLYDPRHGHRCPGDAAGHHHPGDRGPDGPPGHDTENPGVLDTEPRGDPARPHLPKPQLGLLVADFVRAPHQVGRRPTHAEEGATSVGSAMATPIAAPLSFDIGGPVNLLGGTRRGEPTKANRACEYRVAIAPASAAPKPSAPGRALWRRPWLSG